jgi:hypothetical protein
METIISKNKHNVINDLRCEDIARLVDIGQIVDHHCFLKRSFHNMIIPSCHSIQMVQNGHGNENQISKCLPLVVLK